MFWPHSCQLSREIWQSRAGSNGPKLSLVAAPHQAAAQGAAVPNHNIIENSMA
jgi:hypothetical protein